jgi:CubicO group peptidase (beta-lactamase class C family)
MSRAGRLAGLALTTALLPGCRSVALSPPVPACAGPVCDWGPLARLIDSAVRNGAAPGAVVAVSLPHERYLYGAGRLADDDSTRPGPRTIYDLASLTKVVALTTGLMFAVEEGRIGLDDPVQYHLPEFVGPGKDQVTLRHLLTHSSGLPAHRRLWEESGDAAGAIAVTLAIPLDTLPGLRTVYSDLGAILLTQVLERTYRGPIDSLLSDRLFRPLGMTSTRFHPPAAWRDRIAPTEADPWRGRVLRGEVHDENAAWLGGVSGHAGLFGSAEDLLRFGEWVLERWNRETGTPSSDGGPPEAPTAIAEFVRRQDLVPGSSRALGWDTPSPGSSAGLRLSPRSIGHTGFTGTSIWIDPDRQLVVVLLSNRIHPTRDNPRLGHLRPLVADCVVALLEHDHC